MKIETDIIARITAIHYDELWS